MENIGIIIQARTGSTRLPGKMIKPFYNKKSILEIQINNLKKLNFPIVVVTSVSEGDDSIEAIAKNCGTDCFRGSEDDVLSRFVQAGKEFQFDTIIRVCGDNPFLDIDLLQSLLLKYKGEDYLSYQYQDTPTILTHFGFFAEITTLKTLTKVSEATKESFFTEHVTNYIYKNEKDFEIKFEKLPSYFDTHLRLTIDTSGDFETAQEIFSYFISNNKSLTSQGLIQYCKEHPILLERMIQRIENQKK